MNYEYPSEDTIKQIKDLFEMHDEFELAAGEEGYFITVQEMYDYVGFRGGLSTLMGYHKIAELLNCNEGDEFNRYSSRGCETCGFGGKYTLTLRFWRT